MNRFIIAGTDTNVGKTILSSVLMAANSSFSYWKPIQSGLTEETDSETVQRLSQCERTRILPEAYRLSQPLSPHLSASIDGVEIDLQQLRAPLNDNCIIETAGGVLVPITETVVQIELIGQWNSPVVIACRSSLGTINHSLLTIEALRHRGISIVGAVMIGLRNIENEQAVEHFGQVPILGIIPALGIIDQAMLLEVYDTYFTCFKDSITQ